MRAPVPCPHGVFVYVSCMLEWADCLTRGNIDLRSCVACSCEWARGRRPPHQAELTRGLPLTESGAGGRRSGTPCSPTSFYGTSQDLGRLFA